MKKIAEKLEWIFDYYIAYFLYNPNKIDRYHNYLNDKWDFGTEKYQMPEKEIIVKGPQSLGLENQELKSSISLIFRMSLLIRIFN